MANILPDIKELLDHYMREEFAGYDPGTDNPIKFKAKIEDNTIWVFAVGKWRPLREYRIKMKVPSQRVQQEVIKSAIDNCGMKPSAIINLRWHVERQKKMIPVELDFVEG